MPFSHKKVEVPVVVGGGGVCAPPTFMYTTLPCALGGGVGEAGFIFVFNY